MKWGINVSMITVIMWTKLSLFDYSGTQWNVFDLPVITAYMFGLTLNNVLGKFPPPLSYCEATVSQSCGTYFPHFFENVLHFWLYFENFLKNRVNCWRKKVILCVMLVSHYARTSRAWQWLKPFIFPETNDSAPGGLTHSILATPGGVCHYILTCFVSGRKFHPVRLFK